MTFQIRHDGKTYTVHTEVGDGITRVVFDEDRPQTPKDARAQAQRTTTHPTTKDQA